MRRRSSKRSGTSGTSSSSSGEDSKQQQQEELLRTLRMLLQRGRWEAAVHILQQEHTANGQRLKDEALRWAKSQGASCMPAVVPAATNQWQSLGSYSLPSLCCTLRARPSSSPACCAHNNPALPPAVRSSL